MRKILGACILAAAGLLPVHPQDVRAGEISCRHASQAFSSILAQKREGTGEAGRPSSQAEQFLGAVEDQVRGVMQGLVDLGNRHIDNDVFFCKYAPDRSYLEKARDLAGSLLRLVAGKGEAEDKNAAEFMRKLQESKISAVLYYGGFMSHFARTCDPSAISLQTDADGSGMVVFRASSLKSSLKYVGFVNTETGGTMAAWRVDRETSTLVPATEQEIAEMRGYRRE